jgi:hypothetical protein
MNVMRLSHLLKDVLHHLHLLHHPLHHHLQLNHQKQHVKMVGVQMVLHLHVVDFQVAANNKIKIYGRRM